MGSWSLNEKVVLITGGARGIGAGTAAELARRGARPVLADLDIEGLARTAASISPRPLTLELDVTDDVACAAAVARVLEVHGEIDAVWANAGIATFAPMELMDPAAWRRSIEVNLIGAYQMIHAALPAVLERRGYIAVTASLGSFAHGPYLSAYCATKAGVEAMCNSLRLEVAHRGVDVATIHPSWVATDMLRESESSMAAFRIFRDTLRPPFARSYPVERTAKDIARGFAKRQRRICTPRFVLLAHALRPLLTTRLVERDAHAVAPQMARAFEQELAERGARGASVSERVAAQLAASERALDA